MLIMTMKGEKEKVLCQPNFDAGMQQLLTPVTRSLWWRKPRQWWRWWCWWWLSWWSYDDNDGKCCRSGNVNGDKIWTHGMRTTHLMRAPKAIMAYCHHIMLSFYDLVIKCSYYDNISNHHFIHYIIIIAWGRPIFCGGQKLSWHIVIMPYHITSYHVMLSWNGDTIIALCHRIHQILLS